MEWLESFKIAKKKKKEAEKRTRTQIPVLTAAKRREQFGSKEDVRFKNKRDTEHDVSPKDWSTGGFCRGTTICK